jgi:hypothetical protein
MASILCNGLPLKQIERNELKLKWRKCAGIFKLSKKATWWLSPGRSVAVLKLYGGLVETALKSILI